MTVLIIIVIIYLLAILTGFFTYRLPIYGINKRNLKNFSIGDMIIFILALPFELCYIIISSPFNSITRFLRIRPFKNHGCKVGDRVIYKGKVETILELNYDFDFNETVLLDNNKWRISVKEIKRVSPLDKIL